MHTHKSFPWEGDVDSYAGTSASYGHTGRKTAREARGKSKCNKVAPRGLRDRGTLASKPRVLKPELVTVKAQAQPDVVRMGLTNNIGADYS